MDAIETAFAVNQMSRRLSVHAVRPGRTAYSPPCRRPMCRSWGCV